jgi:DNA (cytosine-5)-methyltransferase 1
VKFISLFAGIGGLDLGLERAGMECVAQVEINVFALKVLQKHWPNIPKYKDVRDVGKYNLPNAELICGGFPCQDVSLAGKRAGLEGKRSTLWSEFYRIVCEIRPRWVVAENVRGLFSSDNGQFFTYILRDLSRIGYDVEWGVIQGDWVGIPQSRPRVFIIAYPSRNGECKVFYKDTINAKGNLARLYEQSSRKTNPNNQNYRAGSMSILGNAEWSKIPNRERSGSDGGVPNRMDRYRTLGNAVIPQVAEFVGRCIMNAEARLTQRAADARDSSAFLAFSNPEILSTPQGESNPALHR